MNLTILYLLGPTGDKILQTFNNNDSEVKHKIINIEDQDYYQISIEDNNSYIHKVFNTPRAIRNCKRDEIIKGLLKYSNIAYGDISEEGVLRNYEVIISDMETISIKMIGSKPKASTKYIREKDNQKVAELAKSAMHVVGLDFGQVNVALTARRRYKITAIDPSPEIRDKDLNALLKTINQIQLSDYTIYNNEVRLGADPEFMMLNSKTGKMTAASQFFPREGLVGCDNIRVPNRQQRPVAELRPKPEYNPEELTINIKLALNNAVRLAPYQNIKWIAGSQPFSGYSIGGHIHFSNIKLTGGLLRALDNYLGLVVFLIENPSTAMRRRKKYGVLGEFRLKDHGGFEYRTPGSWLVSQEITLAVLCLAKIVANRYTLLPHNFLNTIEAQQAFYEGDQEYFRLIFPTLWSHLRQLDLYNRYYEELNVIYHMIEKGSNWDEKVDIRKGWNITTPKKIYSDSARIEPRQSTNISNTIRNNPSQTRINSQQSVSFGSRQVIQPRSTNIRSQRYQNVDVRNTSRTVGGHRIDSAQRRTNS